MSGRRGRVSAARAARWGRALVVHRADRVRVESGAVIFAAGGENEADASRSNVAMFFFALRLGRLLHDCGMSTPTLWRLVMMGCWAVAMSGWQALTAADGERPFLSPIFGDHLVMQRGKPNPIWGWTESGATVRVEVDDKSSEARAGADGKWTVAVEPPTTPGPHTITIAGKQTVVLHDVLVGDVWLCGGQSNMAYTLRGARGGVEAAKTANDSELRVFTVGNQSAYAPRTTISGAWKVCTPENAPHFSAVGYFFARDLRARLHVPIGLVVDSVGGSPAEAWMSAQALARVGDFDARLTEIARLHAKGVKEHGSFLMHWLDEYDPGEAWAATGFDDSAWKPVDLKTGFEALGVGETPAVVWFRREIQVPDGAPTDGAKLFLGAVYKMDTTYLNGRSVGASSWSENPRVYPVPAGVLKPGKNTIAVRVFKLKSGAAFAAPAEALRIELADGRKIALADEKWCAAVSVDAKPPHVLPLDFENYATMPMVFHDGMIAPVAPLAVAGFLWYQGEANWKKPQQYKRLLPELIADWRAEFGGKDLPFYIVQLPAFTERKAEPSTDGWAELREAQAEVAAKVPNAGLVVTIDAGDGANIHPIDKEPVGVRLAALALAQHYGQSLPHQGPSVRAVAPVGGGLRVSFDHAEGGLVVRGEQIKGFAVAGTDRVWHWATARLDGADAVVVSAEAVKEPVAVRYAWQGNPEISLFNAAGLPAGPFRSDDWPLPESP